jgi:prepilin-type N-terminal cleavage/methylation domain-containing protein
VDDRGFTLVEIMIALGLLMIVMTAAIPAFLGMLRSTVTTRMETQGKNLTQERLEQMRDLRFHVDRQNGPFLDVLDVYYTNAPTSPVATTVTAGGATLSGIYRRAANAADTLAPSSLPYYRVSTGAIPGATGFSQLIYTQFLTPAGAAVPSSRFEGVYDSQVVGRDQAPSLMIGVTVVTTWVDRGRTKTYKAYTRITDGRPQAPVIQSQAKAVAIDITSTAVDGTTLELQGGISNADGAQSSGSSVSGYAAGALATRTGQTPVSGAASQFALPTTAVSGSTSGGPQSGASCSWYGFGSTSTSNVTGNVSTGLPIAPSNAGGSTPPNVMTGSINKNGSGSCGQLSYDNSVSGGIVRPSTDLLGFEMGAAPFVRVPDVTTGSGPAISGSSYVLSNVLTATPQKTQSGAAAGMSQQLILFPNNPESGGQGLVQVTLTSASVDCVSGSSTVDGTVVGAYDFTLKWWGRGPTDLTARMHTARWTYNSSTAAAPVLVAGSDTWDPVNTLLGNGTRLSQLVTAPAAGFAPATVSVGATSGVRGFSNGIFSMTSASTLTNEPAAGYSAITVQLGQLTCVADDQR